MPSTEMLQYVVRVRTDVSEEFIASIIRAKRIYGLGVTLPVNNNRSILLSAPPPAQQYASVVIYC
jgi:hypothetical protein